MVFSFEKERLELSLYNNIFKITKIFQLINSKNLPGYYMPQQYLVFEKCSC